MNGVEYDESVQGMIKALQNRISGNGLAGSSRSDIISVLKSEIADFEAKTQVNETGRIISINDGIVNIYGLNHAMYGEHI